MTPAPAPSADGATQRLDVLSHFTDLTGLPDSISTVMTDLLKPESITEASERIAMLIRSDNIPEAMRVATDLTLTICDRFYDRLKLRQAATIPATATTLPPDDLLIPHTGTPVVRGGLGLKDIVLLGLLPIDPSQETPATGLTAEDTRLEDLSRPLSPNTPLELLIPLAGQSLHRPYDEIDSFEFLQQVAQWMTLMGDRDALRHAAELERVRLSSLFQPTREFGTDVPFAVIDDYNGPVLDYLRASALACGFPAIVVFCRDLGAYDCYLTSGSPEAVTATLASFQPRIAKIGPLEQPLIQVTDTGFLASTRGAVIKGLDLLRGTNLISREPFSRSGPVPLSICDTRNPDSAFTFFGRSESAPVCIRAIHMLEDVRVTPQQGALGQEARDNLIETVAAQLGLKGNPAGASKGTTDNKAIARRALEETAEWVGVEISFRRAGSPREKPETLVVPFERFWPPRSRPSIKKGSLDGGRGILVEWEGGRTTLHLARSFPDGSAQFFAESFPSRKALATRPPITAFQSFPIGDGPSATMFPLFEPPTIRRGTDRPSPKDLELNFATIPHLPLGTPLNIEPLTLVNSAVLGTLGYGLNADGSNALTNYRGILIPLVKPSDEDFDLREFESIRALKNLPASSWQTLCEVLLGKRLTTIESIALERPTAEMPAVRRDKSMPPRILHRDRQGECYDGPHRSIAIIGQWIIFECAVPDQPGNFYYIMDTPLPDRALYVFRAQNVAYWAAATHSSGQVGLLEVAKHPECVARTVHQGAWREKLNSTIKGAFSSSEV